MRVPGSSQDTEWISCSTAAKSIGIAEDTLEWWIRQGRIQQRPRHGNRPTLSKTSVEEFASTYVPKRRRDQQPHEPTTAEQRQAWLVEHHSLRDVAERFEVSETTVHRWVTTGRLCGDKDPTRGWLRFTYEEVERLSAERRGWISYATAANLIGVSPSTIRSLIRSGALVQRTAIRQQPSISRLSAQEHAARARAENEHRAASHATPPAVNAPPDDGEVWLSLTEAGLVLRLSRARVGQLVQAGRIPATKRGRRWWIQRLHAETLSASRALQVTQQESDASGERS